MLTFKYGVAGRDRFIHFIDSMVYKKNAAQGKEILYGMDVANDTEKYETSIRVSAACSMCKVVDSNGVAVDNLTGLIRVDMPIGSNMWIPEELIDYVQETGNSAYYDGRHYNRVVYMYGVFDGQGGVKFYNGKLRVYNTFDTTECLYRVVNCEPELVGSQCYADLTQLQVRDGRQYSIGDSRLEVYAHTRCQVNIPRLIREDMREYGYTDALFVPIHVNGEWDIKLDRLAQFGADAFGKPKRVQEIFDKYKHFTGEKRLECIIRDLMHEDVTVCCLADLLNKTPGGSAVLAYGQIVNVKLDSTVPGSRYKVCFKSSDGMTFAYPEGDKGELCLSDEFSVIDGKVFITDRPTIGRMVVRTSLWDSPGEVTLIEIEEDLLMSQVTYMYGKFNGRNRVKFHNMELPAKEFYDTQEGIYRIVDGEIAGYYGAQCSYKLLQSVERDGKVYLEGLKLQVAVPAGCEVEFPQSVHYAMRACGDEDALFIPIRVDGTKDYAESGMTEPRQTAIRKAFEECKHLTGPGRFAALMSLLVKTDAEVYCLGDMIDRHTLDCYGVNISCTYSDPKPSEFKKYRMLSRGGEALLQAYEEGGTQVIALDSDYTEDKGSRVIILDRPVPPGTKVQTALSVSMGDVLLIEVPEEETGSIDISQELQRLSTDEKYRRGVINDICKVFKQLPPAMRKEDEAISQVIKLAVSLIRE